VPLLIEEINLNRWPMIKYFKAVLELVTLKQRYLNLLSSYCGVNSEKTQNLMLKWVFNLELRVLAVETVYRLKGGETHSVVDNILTRIELLKRIKMLKLNNLLNYKTFWMKSILMLKRGEETKLLNIISVTDKIVQTLFIFILNPIVNPHFDKYSFGYKKGRSVHEVVGFLAKLLCFKKRHIKLIIKICVEKIFDDINRSWLFNNYPFPRKFKFILKYWLKADFLRLNLAKFNVSDFGLSLINFTLNGVDDLIKLEQSMVFGKGKLNYRIKKQDLI
jgi:retron-type reverse transcriptase